MKKTLARLLCLLLCLAMTPTALAETGFGYLIHDSNTRELTEEELWQWDYESLGYIMNEIFARHGYVFEAGGKYDNYFRCMQWYTPNDNPDNTKACYPQLKVTEWNNQSVIKKVRADMRKQGTTNPRGKSVWDYFSTSYETLKGFEMLSLKKVQTLPVYSAPDKDSYRGANGKAAVSTKGGLMAAGWDNGFLMIMYETNNGGIRVGYVKGSDVQSPITVNNVLNFHYQPATLEQSAQLTDDPARNSSSIANLPAGSRVIYLSTFFNQNSWDYVETSVNGRQARGFIRSGLLDISASVEELDNITVVVKEKEQK